ncbi:MAG TPA: MBOAT family O-acyltransferase [Stellaceae bacterium]|jgi:alginate O-acetyltransferase complex protein AlgI|nr:MBOAT family O-acyltransferase [Stellaceae bacterium]
MSYTDILFLFLLAALCVVSRFLRPWVRLREWVIIAFSLMIVASWGLFSLALLLAIAAINFLAMRIAIAQPPARERAIIIATIVFDIAALAVFKYDVFFLTTLETALDLNFRIPALGLPLAISFYTFHLISYLVDRLRGKIRPLPLRHYLFYLCFIPHLIAGPIVRVWQLPSQLGRVRRIRTDLLFGVHELVVGFFLKAVISNNLARLADPFWSSDPGVALSAADRWLVAFLYYCQIYADFAGYSLMALGMARLLGYRLPANFRAPLLAGTMQDFWRRWHITLSRWLRDYLYISLGGNRRGARRTLANIMITMLLGGLWHGAAWTFVAWGGMQGIGLAAERVLGFEAIAASAPRRIAWWLATQLWVTLAWVFFRATDLPSALAFIAGMLRVDRAGAWIVHGAVLFPLLIAAGAVLHQMTPLALARLPRRYLATSLGLTTGALLVLDLLVYSPESVFIYFRF